MATQEASASFVEQYGSTVMHLLAQRGSRLRSEVRQESQVGKTEYFEQVGPTTARKVTNRFGDSPHIATDRQRRAVHLQDYDWGELFDSFDKVKMLVDPINPSVIEAADAMGRAIDDVIIAAATGAAMADTGTGNGTVSSVSLPTTQFVNVGFLPNGSTANSGLTLAKLVQTKHIMGKNEVPKGTIFKFVLRQQQLTDLLNNVVQVQSSDYNAVHALVKGEVEFFMGMKFIQTERLNNNTTTDQTDCFAFEQQGLLLSIGKDITKEIAQRSDKRFNWYAYFCMSIGATRMEEKRVVKCVCDESP